MPHVHVNGVRLYHEIHGQGEPVVLLNGIMQSTAGWSRQVRELSRRYRVIVHDFRGQGASDKPDEEYTWTMHVEDLRALLDHLGVERVHVVGVSYGAETGMHFALAHPERVRSLVVGTATSEVTPLIRAWADAWAVACATRDGYCFQKLYSPSIFGNAYYAAKAGWLDERAREFGQVVTPEWFEGLERLLRNFLSLDLTPRLGGIKAPTLVVAGEMDVLKPVAQSRIIRDGIPGAEMLVMADCGHVAVLEKPGEFMTAVAGFLARHGGD